MRNLCYAVSMDSSALVTIGLTPLQAEAYLYIVEHGQAKPQDLTEHLNITRTNAYKLLDKLAELKLVSKKEIDKKFVYSLANPIALTDMTAHQRAEAVRREEAANRIMQDLLAKYHEQTDKPGVLLFTGQTRVADAYRRQVNLHEDIYFVHTAADVPVMGFDTMHDIRISPSRHGAKRKAIMAAPADPASVNYAPHQRSNLEITWRNQADYDAPVEWSVTKSSLLIVALSKTPHAILIVDPLVAGAFLQLWQLLDKLLQQQPGHIGVTAAAPPS